MIDAHVHVFAKVSEEFPREVNVNTPPEREATAEQLLETMEASGVEKAILTQIGGVEMAQHAYLLRCLKEYPDRFRGIGLVADPQHPEDQMDRLTGRRDRRVPALQDRRRTRSSRPDRREDVRDLSDLEVRRRERLRDLALPTGCGESLRSIFDGSISRPDGGV